MSCRPVGVWAVDFLCCCGDRGGLPVPTPERRGFSSGIGRWLPLWGWWCLDLGVWVHMGSVSVGTVSILLVYMWGEGVNIRLRAWGWGHMLVYMCACRLRLCVRSGLRLRLTHHLSRPHPTTMPCRWRIRRCVGDFSRRAGCSGERRPTLGGRLAGPGPTGLLGPDCGVGGPLGLRAQGPGPPWDGRLPVSLRACRHGTRGRLHCGCRRSRLRALLRPFLGGGAVVPAVVSPGGPVPWGSLDVWGPGSFPCLLHALAGWAVVPHTHY